MEKLKKIQHDSRPGIGRILAEVFVASALAGADDSNIMSTSDISTASKTVVQDLGGYPRNQNEGNTHEDGWSKEYDYDGNVKVFANREKISLDILTKVLEEKETGVQYDEKADNDLCVVI